jgi:hypothetical protein
MGRYYLPGLVGVSCGQFSDEGCVSVASQAGEVQGISCVLRSVFR